MTLNNVQVMDTKYVPLPQPSNAQWRFTTSFPPGCSGTACSYFLAVRTNEDPLFLDFMMEGNARGWIAVGYTPNPDMVSVFACACVCSNIPIQTDADVFVCALIGGQVTILDTYNIPNGHSNMVDSSQVHTPIWQWMMSYDVIIIAGPVSLQHELCQWKDKMCVSVGCVTSVGVWPCTPDRFSRAAQTDDLLQDHLPS